MMLSDYVVKFIAAQGVKEVFFLPGGGAMYLVDALARQQEMQPVCLLHEQAVAIAAGAYATYTNNLGVGMVTTGPGGTNTITGVAAAWIDSTPCLFVSGQVKTADGIGQSGVRQMGNQEVDIIALVQPITKYALKVVDKNSIRYHMEKAVHLARNGRPGPVWLDIPLDVQGSMIEEESLTGFVPEEDEAGSDELAEKVCQIVALLRTSRRPLILAGNGIRSAKAEGKLRQIAEILQIPVQISWKAIDLLCESFPLFAGRSGTMGERGANFALQNSDWLLCIGTRLDMSQTGFDRMQFARRAKKIMVDVDATEIAKLGEIIDMPVCSDAGRFIDELLRQLTGVDCALWTPWVDLVVRWRERYPIAKDRPPMEVDSRGIDPYAFIDILSNELSGDDVIVPCNAGTTAEITYQALKIKEGQRVPTNHGLGAMGFDLPASVGACLASGGKRTICIAGDGGLQLNIQELATIRRLQLPIKIFVMDNQGYNSIRVMQQNHFGGHLVACDSSSGLGLPDTMAIAKAYGLPASEIRDTAGIRDGIRRVLEQPGPCVCNVSVNPEAKVAPRTATRRLADGSLVSTPLEDMWPFLEREELAENMKMFVLADEKGDKINGY